MNDVPLWRLHLLRAFYLLVTLGLAVNLGPSMGQHSERWAQRKGETAALLSGLAIACVWGLRYPLQMLPLLICWRLPTPCGATAPSRRGWKARQWPASPASC